MDRSGSRARCSAGDGTDPDPRPARHVEGRKRVDRGRRWQSPSPGSSALRLGSVSFTLTIDNQDGRRFSGKFSSPRQTEQIIGVISRDSRVFAVDSDGYTFGTILAPDRVELCYLQLAAKGRVASCTEFKKQS